MNTIRLVLLEVTRLMLGILLLAFHRQIADYVLKQERSLVLLLRQRGLAFPPPPSTETARNIYFIMGTFVVVYEMLRIWLALQGRITI